MPTKPILPGYKALGGSARNYLNLETGEIISRRQYQNLSEGISFEQKAAANKAADEFEQLARPAKGRRSVVKLAPEFKKEVVKARKEKKQEEIEAEKARKEQAARKRKVDRALAKKVHQKKIREQLLKAGNMGARIAFNDYAGYLQALKELRAMGKKVFGYSLGITYVITDERAEAGEERNVTVFTLTSPKTKYSEEEFEDTMESDIDERQYMQPAHYWMHIAFGVDYAREKAKRAGIKRNFGRN